MTDTTQAFWTPGRIIATVIVGALIATMGYTLFSTSHDDGEVVSKVVLPQPTADAAPVSEKSSNAAAPVMPEDYEIPTASGDKIKLSGYRGKVLVLDFWATWCPPCREEIPQLVRIAREQKDRGVEVVGLHIDDNGRSSPEAIQKFIRQFNINYTVGFATDDIFIAYLGEEETAIPQTLIFDRNGKVVTHLIGYDSSHARKLDQAINKALAN